MKRFSRLSIAVVLLAVLTAINSVGWALEARRGRIIKEDHAKIVALIQNLTKYELNSTMVRLNDHLATSQLVTAEGAKKLAEENKQIASEQNKLGLAMSYDARRIEIEPIPIEVMRFLKTHEFSGIPLSAGI